MNVIAIAILLFVPLQKNSGALVFRSILQELNSKTKVVVRLPQRLGAETETNQLYAQVETVSLDNYVIRLSFTSDCEGGNACRYGFVSGEKLSPRNSQLKGEFLPLAKNLRGYFTDATCGANCSDSTISWVQEGVLYVIGIKAEKKETLRKVANSAINNPLPPTLRQSIR